MTNFIVAPFNPPEDITQWTAEMRITDLRIDPDEYRSLLLGRWPGAAFYESKHVALEWSFGEGMPMASLDQNLHSVSCDTPYEEYYLWHRSVIPSRYQLFLYNDSAWKGMELTPETTINGIKRFFWETSR